MRPAIWLLAYISSLFFAVAPSAETGPRTYLEELVEAAREQRLWEERQWLTLGHYETGWLGFGYASVIDTPGFFRAADGKTDPQAELEATLATYFAPYDPAAIQHPQCASIARYHWLNSKLGFDPSRLPEQPCPVFEEWYRTIDPAQVTLIFPSAYLNQPSSMFGHTLLRVDRHDQNPNARLHSYAINYGAVTGDDKGMVFALKGLVGGYPGSFSLMPYYDKVKEYSDLENRDIWEYELNLREDEIRRMMMHVWELGQQNADYYFFDENCSYQLLSLLEVARPSLDLTSRFDWWAIPADTVRAVVKQEGLLSRAVYRPSARAGIDHRLGLMDRSGRALAYALALGEHGIDDAEVQALPPRERAAVLELAYEYLQYRSRAGKEERDPTARRSLELLRARSEIAESAGLPPPPAPERRPDEGHESARLTIGGGRMDDRNFVELRLRPAYHDLVDPQYGFVPGTEIEFLDLGVRYYEGEDNADFEQATVLSIQSLTPRNRFFRPLSWRLDIGAERFRRKGPAEGDVAGTAGAGVGLSYAPWDGAILSVFADGRVTGTPDLPDGVLVDIGPSLGLLYTPVGWWSMNLTATYGFALDGGRTGDYLDARLEQGLAFGRSFALRVFGGLRGDADDPFPEYGASFHWYF